MSSTEVPLTSEAEAEGQDATLASDPPFDSVKEGQVDADDDSR